MSSNKRPASLIGSLVSKSGNLAKRTAVETSVGTPGSSSLNNPFLSRPTPPEVAIKTFLIQARSMARKRPASEKSQPVEIEARLGTIISPYGSHDMRALSSGAKQLNMKGVNRIFHAFVCNISPSDAGSNTPKTNFEGGITRSNYLKWTNGGVSELSPLTDAFSVQTHKNESESAAIKSQLSENEYVETVFCYQNQARINFPHNPPQSNTTCRGHKERKVKLSVVDIALPAAPYDLRLQVASEVLVEDGQLNSVRDIPKGWNQKRVKRRRSYSRIDKSFAWRIDVTEVTTSAATSASGGGQETQHPRVGYEIEMELSSSRTQELIQTSDEAAAHKLAENLARQLWFMLQQINPTHDVLEVEDFLQVHPDTEATRLAIGQCGTIKRFIESGCQSWRSAIAPGGGATEASDGGECKPPRNFIGCMPVNFSRHNIEDVQRSDGDDSSSVGYYLSEKTDGVRYLMVFTGKTVVLIDRASHETKKGFQPKLQCDHLATLASSIQPGAILDGEVVVHRKLRRPIFIVFDVLANSASEPILHLPFEQRLRHLKAASFVKKDAGIDVFHPASVSDESISLPLVKKNFVKRVDLDHLLSNVHEERGMKIYKYGETHNHLTDGIIFQPNMPYVCGTDVNLLKWKYLDTVTIDVEILPPRQNFGRNPHDDDVLRVGVMGEEGTSVDMTRYLRLPLSERHRLEADRAENGSKIAEVGFDPTTGEWYYRTMRPDKVAPNHISTVLGTLLELAESLSTEELRYRMSIPSGTRDTYAKDVRTMQKQLLEHQRRKNKAAAAQR